jgi:ribosome biogenesis protein BRX1
MKDIIELLPHAKKECKIEKNVAKDELTEVCSNHNCSNCLYFEHRKREFILWLFKNPDGPSIKFQINNVYTLKEIRLTGNCLKYSRPLLSFDASFDVFPHLKVAKELLIATFNTPNNHPKSKPFYDHVLSFFNVNNTIFFRNYQILNELSQKFCNDDDISKLQLVEIGPRFSMTMIRVFDGSLGGKTLFTNPFYVSPSAVRRKNYHSFLDRKKKQFKNEQELKEIFEKTEHKDKAHAWLYDD